MVDKQFLSAYDELFYIARKYDSPSVITRPVVNSNSNPANGGCVYISKVGEVDEITVDIDIEVAATPS